MKSTDIDIDVADRDQLLKHLNHIKASIINEDVIKEHNVGIYLQNIPKFLNTDLSSIDYKKAGDYEFFKIDILNNSVYENVKDEAHLDHLLNTEPDWNLLLDDQIISTLFQIHNYGSYLKKWKPNNIMQLAMFIAMIRPSKFYLMNKNSWDEVEKEIWIEPNNDKNFFKKSHSIAYANVIRIQLNLINDV